MFPSDIEELCYHSIASKQSHSGLVTRVSGLAKQLLELSNFLCCSPISLPHRLLLAFVSQCYELLTGQTLTEASGQIGTGATDNLEKNH